MLAGEIGEMAIAGRQASLAGANRPTDFALTGHRQIPYLKITQAIDIMHDSHSAIPCFLLP
jgi:hypothetical protein